jgi:tryptophan 2,3-dioxygenase
MLERVIGFMRGTGGFSDLRRVPNVLRLCS